MPSRSFHPASLGLACAGLILPLLAGGARAEGPGPIYKDRERFDEPSRSGDTLERAWESHGRSGQTRPARRVSGGPGYVGSDWGLGRPAFTGLGTRPDWGRSSE
jgi:hypothetical protein